MNDVVRELLAEYQAREIELNEVISKWHYLFGVIGTLPGLPERLEAIAGYSDSEHAAFLGEQAARAREMQEGAEGHRQ